MVNGLPRKVFMGRTVLEVPKIVLGEINLAVEDYPGWERGWNLAIVFADRDTAISK